VAQRSFIVVGAGLGGLATALRLAHRGHRVTVLERTGRVGGRNRPATVGDCRFDGGPTLMMMRDPFERLFTDVGERMQDHLSVSLCDPSYRVFWDDGARLDGTPNVALMIQQIQAMSGQKDALAYPKLLGDLAALYRDSIPNFVRKNFDSPLDFFGPRQLAMVARHGMIGNLARRIERTLDDPRLRMLFSFQTMYLGLSPYDAPWVYAVLTYMEYGEGIWYPQGGMVEVGDAVARLAAQRGAEIRLNTAVARVEGNTVELESGERLTADAILMNADLPYSEAKLERRPAPRADRRRYSCSTYMLYLDYAGSLPQLLHHNVFFGADYRSNLDDVFHRGKRPEDPAFYACISARTEPAMAPVGHENLYVLVPCPNLDTPFTPTDAQALRDHVYGRLAREVGFDPDRVVASQEYTPNDWAQELNLERGAAFGLSHDFWQSAFFRPSNRSRTNPHLFYVGASTVPGNGLPMVLISAELAEDRLARAGLL